MKKPLQYLLSGGEEITPKAIIKVTDNPKYLSGRGKGPTPKAILKATSQRRQFEDTIPKATYVTNSQKGIRKVVT